MTRLIDDVKSGIKGIRGAGEVIRGEALEAADRAFERDPHHPAVAASAAENRGISDQGRRDVKGMDEMFAKREWEKKGVPRETQTQTQAPVPTTAAATHPPPHQTTHTAAPQGENLTGSTYAGAEGIGHHNGGGGGAYEPGVAPGHADVRQAQPPMSATGAHHPPPPPPHQTAHNTAPGGENLVGAHPRAEGLGHNHGGGVEPGVLPEHNQAREGLHAPTGGDPAYDANVPPPRLPERPPEPGLTTHGEPLHHSTGAATRPAGGLSQDPAANPPSQPRYA